MVCNAGSALHLQVTEQFTVHRYKGGVEEELSMFYYLRGVSAGVSSQADMTHRQQAGALLCVPYK
jgi:hypothetical protein